MTSWLEIAALPAEAEHIPADCYVVIDLLRATTTMATHFGAGLQQLTAAGDIALARSLAAEQNALLLGEVGGLQPEGFDGGNSPFDARKLPMAGRSAVHFTTNGTRALCQLAGHAPVIAGAIANASAVARAVAPFERVVLVCAGNEAGERFSVDDFAGAHVIAREIAALFPDLKVTEAVRLARAAFPDPETLAAHVRASSHAALLTALGLTDDITFALQPDTSTAVPSVTACGEGWAVLRNANQP
jgi:2-phosphosulfolactate phosphatase